MTGMPMPWRSLFHGLVCSWSYCAMYCVKLGTAASFLIVLLSQPHWSNGLVFPFTRPRRSAIIPGGGRGISFRISILASGSSGNVTLLETEHTTLLIDAGLGRKEIERRFEALGRALPERVDAILITHEHTDHSNAVAQLARLWHCPAYLTEPTHREIVKMFTEEPGPEGDLEKPSRKATI